MNATRPSASRRGTGRLEPGARIDNFQIEEILGRGNMGRVYRARDPLGREVAIKMILVEAADEEGLIRFRREGEAMAAVPAHPNVVTVHSTGVWGRSPYLVLDYVAGECLDAVLKKGPLPLQRAVEVGERLCAALAHIHRSGVHHRDLKPANIMLRSDGDQPVVTDFGIAGLRGADRLTRTGDLLGTPLYMAPEQILGLKDLDGRADVWALGVLLFEMLTGRTPFIGKSLIEVTQEITCKPAPSLLELCPDADPELAAIVSKALAKKREARHATPGELGAALTGWLGVRRSQAADPPRPETTPHARRVWALVVAGLLIAAGAALAWSRRDPQPAPAAALAPTHTRAATPRSSQAPAASTSPADVEQELAATQQALDLRLTGRVRRELLALTRAAGERELSDDQARPLLESSLAWAEATLEGLGPDFPAEQLLGLELSLETLGTVNRLRPGLLADYHERGRAVATMTATVIWDVVKQAAAKDMLTASANTFIALGESGLSLDASSPHRVFLLAEFWASWTLGHDTFPTLLYVRVIRAGVQLDMAPRLNMLYGGAPRMIDLISLKEGLDESPLDRYVDLSFRLALGGRINGVASPATLWGQMLAEVVHADDPGLPPNNMALALLDARNAVKTPAERKKMLERALALAPRDPWVLSEVAQAFSYQTPPDPRTGELADRSLERFLGDGHNRCMATSWEENHFLDRAAQIHGRLGNYERVKELILLLQKREEDGEDAASCMNVTILALEKGDLEAGLGLLELTERLMERVRGAWLGSEDRTEFAIWEDALSQTYSKALQLFQQAERPDLARKLVESYRATGRMSEDAAFLKLAERLN